MKNFDELVKKELIRMLDDYEDCSMYGCDMTYTLLEKYNIGGTYTYSSYESKKMIVEYFEDFGEIVENFEFNFGPMNINIFTEPEKFIVVMLFQKAEQLLSKVPFVDENWNNKIVLDEKNICKIKEGLENYEK